MGFRVALIFNTSLFKFVVNCLLKRFFMRVANISIKSIVICELGKLQLFCKPLGLAVWLVGASKCAAMCDSQNAFGEKVRWGKNLNFWVGLRVSIFHFQSVFVK